MVGDDPVHSAERIAADGVRALPVAVVILFTVRDLDDVTALHQDTIARVRIATKPPNAKMGPNANPAEIATPAMAE